MVIPDVDDAVTPGCPGGFLKVLRDGFVCLLDGKATNAITAALLRRPNHGRMHDAYDLVLLIDIASSSQQCVDPPVGSTSRDPMYQVATLTSRSLETWALA